MQPPALELLLSCCVLLGGHGEDQHVPKPPVGPDLGVPELAFQTVPGSLSHPRAFTVERVAAYLDAPCAQVPECKGSNAPHRLGYVAVAGEACPAPVADLEPGHRPVHPVQPAATNERARPLQEEQ